MDKIVVLLVDKQTMFRLGVRQTLSRYLEYELFDVSPDRNILAFIETLLPDLLLLDVDYPSLAGLTLARKIAVSCPAIRIIMLAFNPDDKQLFEIIKCGAVDYLEKSVSGEDLVKTIKLVSQGEYHINASLLDRPKVAERVLKQFRVIYGINGYPLDVVVALLTSRETQILNYVADGNSNKQIAVILKISEQTIKNHVSNILRKMDANDRAHAVFLAIRYGWISTDELQSPAYPLKSTN